MAREKKTVKWLTHHSIQEEDFNAHVIYLFHYAICIGCFSFYLSVGISLIMVNLFYSVIVRVISEQIAILIFLLCWCPSIIQYWIQYISLKPFKNKKIKFLTRFIYPIGCILLIFKTVLLGFTISIVGGYIIIFIRNRFYERLKECKN